MAATGQVAVLPSTEKPGGQRRHQVAMAHPDLLRAGDAL